MFDESSHLDNCDEFYQNKTGQDCRYYLEEEIAHEINEIDGLSIIHFNARSLKANFDCIKSYITNIGKRFNVIAISETWLESLHECSAYELANYKMFNKIRIGKRGGGVALYIHDSIKATEVKTFSVAMNNFLESITVELNIEKGKNIVISCTYRAPGSSIEEYSEFVEKLLQASNNKSMYIVGDTNIDILKYSSHVHTKDFLDMMYSYGVFPQINKPTRVTSYSSTIIDNIFTNVLSTNSKSGIQCNDISDHLPIFYVTEYH